MTEDTQELLRRMYRAFNERDLDAVLERLHKDVDWPNGWEGGWLRGRKAVHAYWTRQFAAIDPHVEPTAFRETEPGVIDVTVRQVVRDLSGAILSDATVRHIYHFEECLIRRMDIG